MERKKFSRRNFVRSAGMLGLAGLVGSKISLAEREHDHEHPHGDGGGGGGAGADAGAGTTGETVTLPIDNGLRQMAQYPQKRPLILLTSRGVQLETPLSVYNEGILTPNDAAFVRYHNKMPPLSIDVTTHRINVTGLVDTPLSLSVNDLKTQFDTKEITAALVCTGNHRGFTNPRVPGGQWGHGAMYNAQWTGVSLKDVLNAAGISSNAVQVTFNGLDRSSGTPPDFVKALDVARAMDGDVMIAYAMNGEDIPMLNGFPVKLVVPGYTGTYWVKHLAEINVIDTVYDGFYMNPAYREPDNDCACVDPGTAPDATRPVTYPRIYSLITNLIEGAKVQTGATTVVQGIAMDLKSGIKKVEFSQDGGTTWTEATLGEDLGKYSFRAWSIDFAPGTAGTYALKVRATSNDDVSQPETAFWQPTGYGYNPIETVNVEAI
jgi:sulfite dehydrogenase